MNIPGLRLLMYCINIGFDTEEYSTVIFLKTKEHTLFSVMYYCILDTSPIVTTVLRWIGGWLHHGNK
jgi:hypothetical protein